MALSRPDILQHGNSANALVDSDSIKGGVRTKIADFTDLTGTTFDDAETASAKGLFKAHSTIVYVTDARRLKEPGSGSSDPSTYTVDTNAAAASGFFVYTGTTIGHADDFTLTGTGPNRTALPTYWTALDDFITTGGSGTVTSVGSGDGLTGGDITGSGSLAVDYSGNANNLIQAATSTEGTAIATSDIILYSDDNDSDAVKRGLVSDLPFSNNAGTLTGATGSSAIHITGTTVGLNISDNSTDDAFPLVFAGSTSVVANGAGVLHIDATDNTFHYNPSTQTLQVENLTVAGTTTTVNTETLQIDDNILEINRQNTETTTGNYTGWGYSGMKVFRGDATAAEAILFDESGNYDLLGSGSDVAGAWIIGTTAAGGDVVSKEGPIAMGVIATAADIVAADASDAYFQLISVDKAFTYTDVASPAGVNDTVATPQGRMARVVKAEMEDFVTTSTQQFAHELGTKAVHVIAYTAGQTGNAGANNSNGIGPNFMVIPKWKVVNDDYIDITISTGHDDDKFLILVIG